MRGNVPTAADHAGLMDYTRFDKLMRECDESNRHPEWRELFEAFFGRSPEADPAKRVDKAIRSGISEGQVCAFIHRIAKVEQAENQEAERELVDMLVQFWKTRKSQTRGI